MRKQLFTLALVVLALNHGAKATGPTPPAPPPRSHGEDVDGRYQVFAINLEADHQALRRLIDELAPALAPRLSREPARPVPYGYQLVPKLIPDPPPAPVPERPRTSAYSWPWTREMIEVRDKTRLDLRGRIARARALEEPARTREIEALIGVYQELEGGLHLVDAHVKYNHFWQAEIARDRPRYDHQTALHDQVVAREALRDKLAAHEDPALRAQEVELARVIHEAAYGDLRPPPFLTAAFPRAGLRVLKLRAYTDIEDAAYVEAIRHAVEGKWHVVDGAKEDRLELELHVLAPAAVESPAPARGDHIDVNAHIGKFPADGAVLTTGGTGTYALPGRAMVLGPQDISPTTLSHEFGHLFGFIDGYFRGYRDRGEKGFDVLEIVPDMTDIMCAPGVGHVQHSHFDAVFRAIEARDGAPGPSADHR